MNRHYEQGAQDAWAKFGFETREKAEARVPAKKAVPTVPNVGWKEQKTPPASLKKGPELFI
jgi:hypothetical protein